MQRNALLSLAAFCALSVSGLVPSPRPENPGVFEAVAHAQDAAALSTCTLKGSVPVAKGTMLYDAAKDGRPIAEFVGAAVGVALTVPADAANGRARLVTSPGRAALRLEGWVQPGSLPLYSAKDIPVIGKQVQIASGQRLKPTKAQGGNVSVELPIAGSQDQVARGTASCDMLSVEWSKATALDPPEKSRSYLMKTSTLDFYDRANGSEIYTLNMNEGASPMLWSVESRGLFVRVQSRSDVVLDAWVKLTALAPIRKEDRIDTPPSAPQPAAGGRLVVDNPPPARTASKDVPVRARRDDKEKPIGVLESGAEVYVMAMAEGWANVLPKHLSFAPPDGGGFWIAPADVPR